MKATQPEPIHILHLQWAIRFSEVDLEKMERGMLIAEGGLEELKYKLYEFVRDSNLQGNDRQLHKVANPTGSPTEFVALLTGERLKQIQTEFRGALWKFAEDKLFSLELMKRETDKKPPTVQWWGVNPLLPFMQTVEMKSDDPVRRAVLALGLHVSYSGLPNERIRRCPVDDRIFIRERKPQKGREQYCSLTCTQAAATRNYRLKKKAADAAEIQTPKKPAAKERRGTAPRKTKKR